MLSISESLCNLGHSCSVLILGSVLDVFFSCTLTCLDAECSHNAFCAGRIDLRVCTEPYSDFQGLCIVVLVQEKIIPFAINVCCSPVAMRCYIYISESLCSIWIKCYISLNFLPSTGSYYVYMCPCILIRNLGPKAPFIYNASGPPGFATCNIHVVLWDSWCLVLGSWICCTSCCDVLWC